MWSGIYEFEVDGKTYKVTSSVSSNTRGLIKEVVKVEYDANDSTINVITSERFLPIIFIVVGLVVIISGINLSLESRNENTKLPVYTYDYEVSSEKNDY